MNKQTNKMKCQDVNKYLALAFWKSQIPNKNSKHFIYLFINKSFNLPCGCILERCFYELL